MEINNITEPTPNDYALTQKELDQIESDADTLLKLAKYYWESEDEVRIEWSAESKKMSELNKYQEFLVKNFGKTFEYEFYLEQYIYSETSGYLAVVIEFFPANREKIIDVAKYISATAKSFGCSYKQTFLNLIADDDPRLDYENK